MALTLFALLTKNKALAIRQGLLNIVVNSYYNYFLTIILLVTDTSPAFNW